MFTGYLFILTAASCWGLIGVISSIAFAEGVQPMEVAFWRGVITWFCFALQAIIRKETRFDKKDLPQLTLFSIFGITVFYISYQYAVKTGGAAFAAVLLYTAPAWVVLCSYFIYREPLTRIKLGAVGMVILGVYLISVSGGNSNSDGSIGMVALVSGLTAGFCYSLYYTIGKYFTGKYSSANLFLYVLPLGVLGILPFVEFVHKSPTAWAALISVSVFSTFLANYCYYNGLKYLEAGRASIVATIEPVVAAVAAYFVLNEYFTLTGYCGAALVVGAVLATIYEQQAKRKKVAVCS